MGVPLWTLLVFLLHLAPTVTPYRTPSPLESNCLYRRSRCLHDTACRLRIVDFDSICGESHSECAAASPSDCVHLLRQLRHWLGEDRCDCHPLFGAARECDRFGHLLYAHPCERALAAAADTVDHGYRSAGGGVTRGYGNRRRTTRSPSSVLITEWKRQLSGELSLATSAQLQEQECDVALHQTCLKHVSCAQLWSLFRTNCVVDSDNTCIMPQREACWESFEGLLWTGLGRCRCSSNVSDCHWIRLHTNFNKCIYDISRSSGLSLASFMPLNESSLLPPSTTLPPSTAPPTTQRVAFVRFASQSLSTLSPDIPQTTVTPADPRSIPATRAPVVDSRSQEQRYRTPPPQPAAPQPVYDPRAVGNNRVIDYGSQQQAGQHQYHQEQHHHQQQLLHHQHQQQTDYRTQQQPHQQQPEYGRSSSQHHQQQSGHYSNPSPTTDQRSPQEYGGASQPGGGHYSNPRPPPTIIVSRGDQEYGSRPDQAHQSRTDQGRGDGQAAGYGIAPSTPAPARSDYGRPVPPRQQQPQQQQRGYGSSSPAAKSSGGGGGGGGSWGGGQEESEERPHTVAAGSVHQQQQQHRSRQHEARAGSDSEKEPQHISLTTNNNNNQARNEYQVSAPGSSSSIQTAHAPTIVVSPSSDRGRVSGAEEERRRRKEEEARLERERQAQRRRLDEEEKRRAEQIRRRKEEQEEKRRKQQKEREEEEEEQRRRKDREREEKRREKERQEKLAVARQRAEHRGEGGGSSVTPNPSTSCLLAIRECETAEDAHCKFPLAEVKSRCAHGCNRTACSEVLRRFFDYVPKPLARALSFCSCPNGAEHCPEKEILQPPCMYEPASDLPSCERVRDECAADRKCRALLAGMAEECAIVRGACDGGTRCTELLLAARGQPIDTQCRCRQGDASCAELRATMIPNHPCLVESRREFYRREESYESLPPPLIKNDNSMDAERAKQAPSSSSSSSSTRLTTTAYPPAVVLGGIGKEESAPWLPAPTVPPATPPPVYTTHAPPPAEGCVRKDAMGRKLFFHVGSFVRMNIDWDGVCSSWCECRHDATEHTGGKMHCSPLFCAPGRRNCTSDDPPASHVHGEKLYLRERGACTCIQGSYTCEMPPKENQPDLYPGLYLFIGYAEEERALLKDEFKGDDQRKFQRAGFRTKSSAQDISNELQTILDRILPENTKCQLKVVDPFMPEHMKNNALLQVQWFGYWNSTSGPPEALHTGGPEKKCARYARALVELFEDNEAPRFQLVLSIVKQMRLVDTLDAFDDSSPAGERYPLAAPVLIMLITAFIFA